MVGLKTEGAGGGDIAGAVVDEQGGWRVQIETGGGAPENRRIGLDQPFFPGHQDSVEAAQHVETSARRGEGFAAEIGQAVNRQAAVLEMVEDLPRFGDGAGDHFLKTVIKGGDFTRVIGPSRGQ